MLVASQRAVGTARPKSGADDRPYAQGLQRATKLNWAPAEGGAVGQPEITSPERLLRANGLFDVDTGLVHKLGEVRCADLMPSRAWNSRVVAVAESARILESVVHAR